MVFRTLIFAACLLITTIIWAQSPTLQQAYVNKTNALQEQDTAAVMRYAGEIIELIQQEYPTGGETYVGYTYDLSTTFQQVGAWEEAAQWYQVTADQYKLLFGDGHESVGITLYNLGGIQEWLNDLMAAKEYYEQAFDILYNALGPYHQYTQLVVTSQKALFQRTGDTEAL